MSSVSHYPCFTEALTVNQTSQIGCIVSINVATLIALVFHFLVMPLEIKVVAGLPLHGEAVGDDIVAANVLIQRRVVHPAVALDLSTEQFDAELVFDERHVYNAFHVFTTMLINRNAKVATPLHGDGTTGDIDQTAGGVFTKQGALWSTQYFDTLNVKVLHQYAAGGAEKQAIHNDANGRI